MDARDAAPEQISRRPWLRRLLPDLRPGEGLVVVLLACNAFLMLTSYYVLKTVREPLIILGGQGKLSGAELKTYAAAAQALLLVGLVPVYARVASRTNRVALINGTIAGLIACLLIFNVLGHLDVPIGIPFYLWLGITSLVGVAQFWSLANDLYDRKEGERLFPLIAAGGSLGAIVGARAAKALLNAVGVMEVMLVAAGLLSLYLLLYNVVERRRGALPAGPAGAKEPIGRAGTVELFRRTPYLLLIGTMVLFANLVNTQGEYILSTAVNAHAKAEVPDPTPVAGEAISATAVKEVREARRRLVGQFYGDFYSGVNFLAFLMQTFLVARLFKKIGVHRALFIFPFVALGAYGMIGFVPVFTLIGVAKVLENSTDYSIHNTVRQALFLPTTREAKYKAKAAIDTFFLRAGDLTAAGAVFAGNHLLGFSIRQFAVANMVLIGGWLLVVALVARHYDRLSVGAVTTEAAVTPTMTPVSGPAHTNAAQPSAS